jgi:hypothetical protein
MSKYPDIFEACNDALNAFAPGFPRVLVRDGTMLPAAIPGWKVVDGWVPFSCAGNANVGWQAVAADSDILHMGDDVRFKRAGTIEALEPLAYSDPLVGILSPQVEGGAGATQRVIAYPEDIRYSEERLAFVCVYIKREVLDRVGLMDEQFAGYGYDDVDYCLRTKNAGYKLGVTPRVIIKHMHDRDCTNTFVRNRVDVGAQNSFNRELFRKKWGHANLS